MKAAKYINTDPASHTRLSRVACALLIPLTLLSNKDNEISKPQFIKAVGWITDYRTWNRYWSELREQSVITQLDTKIWMVSPHHCYAEGQSRSALIQKWNKAYEHAIS